MNLRTSSFLVRSERRPGPHRLELRLLEQVAVVVVGMGLKFHRLASTTQTDSYAFPPKTLSMTGRKFDSLPQARHVSIRGLGTSHISNVLYNTISRRRARRLTPTPSCTCYLFMWE